MTKVTGLKSLYCAAKRSRAICKINQCAYSPWIVVLWGILTFAAFALSREILFYTCVITYGLYVIVFCDDLAPIMPLFLLCYITSSPSN